MKKIMRKSVLKITLVFIIIVCIAFCIKIYPNINKGYEMYKSAITEKSIEEVVKEYKEDENYIKLEDISEEYISLLLKSEDQRFYQHLGFDPIAMTRAMYHNIQLGYFAEGGSTITQQLAKNMYFSFEKKIERKVAELFVAIDLEKELTKDEILELYCNIAYFGEGCYGIKEASNHYYGVNPSELSKEQASALVFTLKSPNKYNPNVYESVKKVGFCQNPVVIL